MDEDIVLIQSVKQGDRAAFDLLVRKHMKPAYAYCKRILNNHQDAEDASQNAFLKAYRYISGFEGKSSFKTWFYTILTNECMNRIKSVKTMPVKSISGTEHDLPAPEPRLATVFQGDADFISQQVKEAVNSLPERQRLAFALNCYQGLDYKEIAGVLSCSYENVKVLISLARKSLRERLKNLVKDGGMCL
ncbi:MAG: RNA polymerase sigma factor [Planctomycetes bacterium]|nr:RNA polymerase sigma factor [Planctomycetota bacterium]